MKKTAIIGIGIAIVVAGLVGIYAVSTLEGGTASDSGVGLGDEASVTIQEPKDGEEISLGDKAGATVENPEEKEKMGLKDSASATVKNP